MIKPEGIKRAVVLVVRAALQCVLAPTSGNLIIANVDLTLVLYVGSR